MGFYSGRRYVIEERRFPKVDVTAARQRDVNGPSTERKESATRAQKRRNTAQQRREGKERKDGEEWNETTREA